MRTSGIYSIVNKINGKIYVGSAIYIKDRWSWHRKALERNKHHNILLQRGWNKYWGNYEFKILEIVEDKLKLIEREQFWIDWLKPEYNIYKIAGSPLGRKHSEETKAKIGVYSKNKIVSAETRNKMSIYHKNRSEEHKKNMSIALSKRVFSAIHRQRLSEANQRRKLRRENAKLQA